MKYYLMENKEHQLLAEIKSMMDSIRTQLEILESKMFELQNSVCPDYEDMDPIDLDIEDIPDFKSEPDATPELEFYPEPEPEVNAEPQPEVVEEEESEVVEDLPAAEENDDDDLPFFMEPEPVQPVAVEPILDKAVSRTVVIDTMIEKHAWRFDMPGTQVKDIRSAISLNDRIIFINYLFNEDPLLFQNTLSRINQLNSFDEAVEMVVAEYPQWNLESEVVYRFMMAVRRKLK